MDVALAVEPWRVGSDRLAVESDLDDIGARDERRRHGARHEEMIGVLGALTWPKLSRMPSFVRMWLAVMTSSIRASSGSFVGLCAEQGTADRAAATKTAVWTRDAARIVGLQGFSAGGPPRCAGFPQFYWISLFLSADVPPMRIAPSGGQRPHRDEHPELLPPFNIAGDRVRDGRARINDRQARVRLRPDAGILAELRPARIHTVHAGADAAHDAAAGQLPGQGVDRHAARSHGPMENRGMGGGCDAHHRWPGVPAHSAAVTECQAGIGGQDDRGESDDDGVEGATRHERLLCFEARCSLVVRIPRRFWFGRW